jgi:hypothetical protein
MQHREFMKRDKVVESLAPIHRHVVHSGLQYFGEIKEEALSAAKLRWSVSSNEVKNREPFGFMNFQAATLRLERYAKIIMEEGPSWIGCRYIPPSFGILLRVIRVLMKSVRKGNMLLLKSLKVSMGSRGLEKRPLHSPVSLLCI